MLLHAPPGNIADTDGTRKDSATACVDVGSSKVFDTLVPSVPIEELVLPGHAGCVFSRLCYSIHS